MLQVEQVLLVLTELPVLLEQPEVLALRVALDQPVLQVEQALLVLTEQPAQQE